METESTLIASGNLASARRTITGVLGQLMLLDVAQADALVIFTNVGLPARALEEPDFPISLDQELAICLALVRNLDSEYSATRILFSNIEKMGIEQLGVLGMAMRHAANAVEALKVCVTYPQLTWGHSRMVVRRQSNASFFTFAMERPRVREASSSDIDKLVNYCLTLDLVTSLRNIEDIVESGQAPLFITFPFPQPQDWDAVKDKLSYPVEFDREEACLADRKSVV